MKKSVTSERVGKIASKVVRSPWEDKLARSTAGSALSQRPSKAEKLFRKKG